MRVTVRGVEKWCAYYSFGSGKDRSFVRGFGDTEAAAVKARELRLKQRIESGVGVSRGERKPSGPKSPKLSAVLVKWLDSYAPGKIREEGKQKYRRDFELHILPFLDKGIRSITPDDLEELFWRTLPAEGRSPRSIFNAYRALGTCMNYAVRKDMLVKNPCQSVEVKRPESAVSKDDDKWINRRVSMTKGMLKWLSDPSNEYHDHYPRFLMMFLGLRRAELLGLEWSNFSQLDKKGKATLVVEQQLKRKTGNGWYLDRGINGKSGTKNRKSRTIPIPELWRVALLEEKEKGRVAKEEWASDLVFLLPPDDAGKSRWIDYKAHQDRWEEILTAYVNHRKQVKEPIDPTYYWRPHANRHIAASLLFDAGVQLEVAQEILGHSDKAITQYYTHLTRRAKVDATLRLEGQLTEKFNK